MLAAIASGHADAADLLFLIAAVLFGVAAIIAIARSAAESALVPAGLCLVAVSWLLL